MNNQIASDVFSFISVFSIISSAILNPKAPKEPAKTFSFDYSYWSHTTVSRQSAENFISRMYRCPKQVQLNILIFFLSYLAARRPQLCITGPCVQ